MKRIRPGLMTVGLMMFGLVSPVLADSIAPPASAFGADGQPISTMKSLEEIEPRKAILALPYVITNAGSYYLAGNLSGTSTNQPGIKILCSDVQLDLRGFALIGTNNTLDGIRVMGTNQNITIRNGSIRQWGGFGISASNANDSTVVDVKAHMNGFCGIALGDSCLVSESSAYGNGYKAPAPPAYNAVNPNADTDADGMKDSFEQKIIDCNPGDNIISLSDVLSWYTPAVPTNKWDFDLDGVANKQEEMDGTDPTDPNDNMMRNQTFTDSDFDGMADSWEMRIVTNNANDAIWAIQDVWPWRDPVSTNMSIKWDYDNDGYENRQEYTAKTDPLNPSSYPTNTSTQTEYANYTAPTEQPVVDEFKDPTDEPRDDGIRVGKLSTVERCKVRGNRGSGIYATYASRVTECVAAENLTDGIHVSDYCAVGTCTLARNRKNGITMGSKCRVTDNNCGQNGDFQKNNASLAQGAGIRILGSGNRVENNNVCGNALGIEVDSTFNSMGMTSGQNLIIGNSSVDNWGKAFQLATGDFMGGQRVTSDVSNPTGTTTNAAMDSGNPFSNFSF